MYFTSFVKGMKVLIATEKPFAKKAVDGIVEILQGAGHTVALLEKYTDKTELLNAVADVGGYAGGLITYLTSGEVINCSANVLSAL